MRLKLKKHTREKSYAQLADELVKYKCLSARANRTAHQSGTFFLTICIFFFFRVYS